MLDLQLESEQVKLLAEITLTLVLFADASRISLRALRREFAVPLRLLGIGLPLTIAAGTLVGALVIPGISVAEAAVLAVVLACTDAALGQAVVTDERIPSRVRQGLNVESGLNDGLCVPIFFIAIAVAEADAGTSSGHAATNLVLEQIGYGLLGGIPAGILGALALRFSARRELIEPHWMQILTVASALLAAGIASALGGSIFIAAFTGGFVFGALRQDAGGRCEQARRRGRRALRRRDLHRVRRGHPRPGPRRADLAGRALRRAEPDRRPDAPGRARAARDRRASRRRWRSWAGSGRAAWPRSCSP